MNNITLLKSTKKIISCLIEDLYSIEIDYKKEVINIHVYFFAEKKTIKLYLDDMLEHHTSAKDFINYFKEKVIEALRENK